MTRIKCECADRGCGECAGKHADTRVPATMVSYRVDMERFTRDHSADVAFCEGCWTDAAESGLFGVRRAVRS